ncbi:membrane-spanning 4-domains subfamily A member 4D-like [Heterodontus francisci]|uniref:membrane-spanning 4-domains subfamily A member 4D-like n=1 Tax=Heterodontus francisci TaxID=7792 RepID=UPI00355B65CF
MSAAGFAGDRVPVVTNLYPSTPPSGLLGMVDGQPREGQGSHTRPGGHSRGLQGYEKMLRGELKALGVTQIMVGIVHFTFGIPLFLSLLSTTAIIGTPWWGGLLFIISGSMSVATERRPHRCLVAGCLAMNIVSSVSAAIAGFLYFADLFLESCSHLHLCLELRDMFDISTSLKVILLMFDVLELVLALTVSTFTCRGLRCCMTDSTVPAVVIHTIMHPGAYPVSYTGSHSSVNPSYNPDFTLSEKIV